MKVDTTKIKADNEQGFIIVNTSGLTDDMVDFEKEEVEYIPAPEIPIPDAPEIPPNPEKENW